MKIHPVGAELFHAERRTGGRTDMTRLLVAFRNFANAPKKKRIIPRTHLCLRQRYRC